LGTTFKIYLPRVEGEASTLARDDQPQELLGGTETVLLVEDEEIVRNVCVRVLDASAPWWTQQKGKEDSRREEERDNVRNLVLGRLRRLPERFGGQEAGHRGPFMTAATPFRGGG